MLKYNVPSFYIFILIKDSIHDPGHMGLAQYRKSLDFKTAQ